MFPTDFQLEKVGFIFFGGFASLLESDWNNYTIQQATNHHSPLNVIFTPYLVWMDVS